MLMPALLMAVSAPVLAQPPNDPLLDSAAPMRWRAALVPEDGPELELPEYFSPLDRARAFVQAGRYKRAMHELVGKEEADEAEGALILAEASFRLGRYDEAAATLAGLAEPAAVVLAARIEAERGQQARAAQLLDERLAAEPRSLHARLLRARLAEESGDLQTAVEHYRWFVDQRYLQEWTRDPDGRRFEAAEDVVAIGTALDRYATIESEYRADASLHNAILGMFVRAYDVIDRSYWPARLAAAQFAYERSDRAAVAEELEAVFAHNQRSPEALALLGHVSLDSYDFGQAGRAAIALREINPNSRDADLLDARSLLLQRQPLKAQPFVDRLLSRRADDLDALAYQAAIHAVRLREDELAATLARIEAIDADNAAAYYTVGSHLSGLRQYPRAEQMLRTAIARAPWWMHPRNTLGLLLTQSGDEEGAIRELAAAREFDPFNAQTSNYLQLLQELANYDELVTDHFVIQYDKAQDPLTAELLAEYLDEMQEDVARIYRWAPEEKTRIQVFPTHDRFSVRVAGDPFVGTVAACTGPVIAMVTPRDGREALGQYDTPQVIRHEFTHTITLGRTNNRIPHWMTEGLAVREEQAPIRPEWLELIAEAFNNGELFGVGELTWGFVRPRKPTDRSLAYAQSWLVCEYIGERWGEEKLQATLDEFAKGRQEAEVFRDALEIELAAFDADFLQHMRQQMHAWGRLPEQVERYRAAMTEAEQALADRDFPTAVAAFELARELRPADADPVRRLAGLYQTGESEDKDKALQMLLWLSDRSERDNRFAKSAARLLLELGEPQKAQELAHLAVQAAPYDRPAHELLLEAARATGDEQALATQQRRLEILRSMR